MEEGAYIVLRLKAQTLMNGEMVRKNQEEKIAESVEICLLGS